MPDDTVVYRRFNQSHVVADGKGGFRVASSVLRDSNGVSVDDGALCTPEEAAGRETGSGIISIPKSELSQEGVTVAAKPEPGNAAHCEIGDLADKKAKRLARKATVLFAPKGYEVAEDGKSLKHCQPDP